MSAITSTLVKFVAPTAGAFAVGFGAGFLAGQDARMNNQASQLPRIPHQTSENSAWQSKKAEPSQTAIFDTVRKTVFGR